jgi:hypothetical protein
MILHIWLFQLLEHSPVDQSAEQAKNDVDQ